MIKYAQELTLDFSSFKTVILNLAKDYEHNSTLRTEFTSFLDTLKKLHKICMDMRKNSRDSSLWWSELKNLYTNELNQYDKYNYGSLLQSILKDDFLDFFSQECNIKKIESAETDVDRLCTDLALKSYFKIILTNNIIDQSSLNSYSFKSFIEATNSSPKSLLLKELKSIDFPKNSSLHKFLFLSPFLYPSTKITISDKHIFKDPNHSEILKQILSFAPSLEEVLFRTNFYESDKDKVIRNNISDLKNSFPGVEFNLEPYKRHQRKITNEYFTIIADHTIDIIDVRNNNSKKEFFTRDDMNFTIKSRFKY